MFEIIDCIEGTQCHELEDIADHIRRIFDLTLSSQVFEFFVFVLKQEDSYEIAQMKVDVLKIVCLSTYGNKYFTEGRIPKYDSTTDGLLGQRLNAELGKYDLVMLIQQQVKSRCVEVIDMTYLALGTYLRNGVDISSLFFDPDSFNLMYAQLGDATGLQTLKYAVWCLYIYTLKCFKPGQAESSQLLIGVQLVVSKLIEILQL
jgi:hypothetical protein